jgi:two-component sensor histidine kinase
VAAKTNRLLKQKTEQLAAVREISRAIAEAQDLDTTLELITQRTTGVMGVQSCSLYLYDDQETALVLAASTGLNQAGIGHMSLAKGEGLTGWAAEHSQLVAVANAEADLRFHRMVGSGESRFASLMALPLTTRGKVIGAANVQTTLHHTFSDDEIELFSIITDLAATAIEKARLVQNAVVREIHHRVKNNLQTIAMLLRLQVAQADGLTPEDILHETINRVLSIATVHEILAHERQTHVGLKRLIKQVSQIIVSSMTINELVSVSVEGDDLQLPSQFATNLALITNELLQNALEHSLTHQQEGEIQIYLALTQTDLLITVTDNGLGLPQGFALEADSGLGLELIHTMVVEDLGGSFTLEDAPEGGARAVVNVPLASIKE